MWAITNKPIMLNFKKINKKDIHLEDDRLEIDTYYGELSSDIYEFKEIFNTRAEAKHYLHHANIIRTETLPFLTWEDFCRIGIITFTGTNKLDYELIRDYGVYNAITIYENGNELFEYGLTEDNFYKAYDECVRLFKEKK